MSVLNKMPPDEIERVASALLGDRFDGESYEVIDPAPWHVLCPCGHECFLVRYWFCEDYEVMAICPICKARGVKL